MRSADNSLVRVTVRVMDRVTARAMEEGTILHVRQGAAGFVNVAGFVDAGPTMDTDMETRRTGIIID
jgi:hypothetical protein